VQPPTLTDAGLTDAGLTDAGLTDAGLTDAGLTDAGLTTADLAGRFADLVVLPLSTRSSRERCMR
jgi:uncharacterized protein YjbI with pentapeptide repeats